MNRFAQFPAWPAQLAALILGLLMLVGCNGDVRYTQDQARQISQAQEDAVALVVVAKGQTLPEAVASLIASIEARLSAANANQRYLPPAFDTATNLVASLQARIKELENSAAAKSKPPAGTSWLTIGSVIAGAAVGFTILKKVAPFIPYIGPAWAAVINGGYAIFQHAAAKALDKAALNVQRAAAIAKPVLESVRALAPPGSITPVISQALDTLAAATPAKGT